MWQKNRWLILLMIIYFLSFETLWGSGFTSLKLGADSRSAGFGMAFTALADDGSVGFWNPAGLAWMKGTHLVLTHHRWIFDVKSEFIGIGTGWQNRGIGFHVLYTNMGDLELRKTPSPEPLGTFSAYELIGGISYGQKIADRITLGTTLKLYYEKITACQQFS